MEVIRIEDLDLNDAVKFLKDKRHKKDPDEVYERYVREHVGGRLAFLNRLAKANDLEGKHCEDKPVTGDFYRYFPPLLSSPARGFISITHVHGCSTSLCLQSWLI